MTKSKYPIAMLLISSYFLLHGILYIASSLTGIKTWSILLTFLFGNATLSVLPVVPLALGAAYICSSVGLLLRKWWAHIAMLLLCVQAVFFEFPVGSIVSGTLIACSLLPRFSKLFEPGGKQSYPAVGFTMMFVSIVAILVLTGAASGIIKLTAYQVRGFETSSETPESKISTIDQRVGLMDVLIELTASPDNALEQQDIVLEEVASYVINVKSRLSEVSNALVVTIEASYLDEIAENRYISRIYPVKPSFRFLPCELSQTVPFANFVPIQLEVENLWSRGLTGKGITVAIMDTGIKEDHPDLQRDGKSIVVGGLHLHGEYVCEHGTMVASCIANQNPQYKGVAPDVNILNIEVFSWQTIGNMRYLTATNADILQGFEFVANWKKLTGDFVILSCSWGVSSKTWSHDADVTVAAANRLASEYNIPVIAAAGNSGPGSLADYVSIPFQVMSPAGGKNVLSVGAVDSNNNVASFSSRGPYYDGIDKPDVVAPGVDVPVLGYAGITVASGTSFACPYVSGVAALLAQENKDLSSAQLYDAIKTGAVDLGMEGYDYEYGYGIVNAEKSKSFVEQTVTSANLIFMLVAIIVIGIVLVMYPGMKRK